MKIKELIFLCMFLLSISNCKVIASNNPSGNDKSDSILISNKVLFVGINKFYGGPMHRNHIVTFICGKKIGDHYLLSSEIGLYYRNSEETYGLYGGNPAWKSKGISIGFRGDRKIIDRRYTLYTGVLTNYSYHFTKGYSFYSDPDISQNEYTSIFTIGAIIDNGFKVTNQLGVSFFVIFAYSFFKVKEDIPITLSSHYQNANWFSGNYAILGVSLKYYFKY